MRATEAECAAIANHLGMSVAAFQSRFLQPDGATLKDGLGGRLRVFAGWTDRRLFHLRAAATAVSRMAILT